MRIIIDISHPAHANFFKNIIKLLEEQGHSIVISVLNRGRLRKIIYKEYPGYQIVRSGKYRNNRFSIIVEANILRFFRQLYNILRYRIQFGLSSGSFTLGAAMRLFGRPNFQFDDDPERSLNVKLEKLTANKVYFPPIIEKRGNIEIFNALKEWSYLSPNYFKPNPDILKEYKLENKKYIFIREVQTKSLNYSHQIPGLILSISQSIPDHIPILLSLEDKSNISSYPKHWKLLNEPVQDIHSLIYYSKIVLSSGDSMAREGAQLGVPSIYCGARIMKANSFLIQRGMLFHVPIDQVDLTIKRFWEQTNPIEEQQNYRNKLVNEWDDIPKYVMKQVDLYFKQKTRK